MYIILYYIIFRKLQQLIENSDFLIDGNEINEIKENTDYELNDYTNIIADDDKE